VRLEGPALIVDQPEVAEGRFPIRLLFRVVVRGPVPWSMEALLACLAGGVPITFLSLDGAVIGLCLGRDRPEESLTMLLDRLLAEPGWAEIHMRWCRAAERRAIVEVARRLALPVGADLRPEVVRTLAAAQMPGGDTPGARSAMRRLDGYLYAHLCELFGHAGVPPEYRADAARRSIFGLLFAAHCGGISGCRCVVGWSCGRIIRRRVAGRLPRAVAWPCSTRQIAARFRRLLASLDRLLREEVP
jgi:hypothetical protein